MRDNIPPDDTGHSVQRKWAWAFWPTVGFGLAIGGAYLLIGLLVGLVFAAVVLASHPHLTMSALVADLNGKLGLLLSIEGLFTALICIGLMAVFIRARKGVSVAEYLGLKRIGWKTLLAALVISGGFLLLSGGLSSFLKLPESQFDINIYKTSAWPPLLWMELVVFAPAFEETFFRGFLFEGFRQSRMGGALTIFVTALAWSSLHIQYDIYGIATIFVFGLVLGTVRLKTGSLWSTLAMHAFWNLIAAVQIGIQVGMIK